MKTVIKPKDGDIFQVSLNAMSDLTDNAILDNKEITDNKAEQDLVNISVTDSLASLTPLSVKLVTSPYTLLNEDKGEFIVFNEGDSVIDIPEGLPELTSITVANIGAGGVSIFSQGSEVIKGSNQLHDVDGMMSIIKLTNLVWQSSERGDSVTLWSSLSNVTEIWVYGASISNDLVNTYENVLSSQLQLMGHTGVTIVNKSLAGRGIGATLTTWEAEKATIAGRDDILLVTHPIGNDVSGNRPWATVSQPDKDLLINTYKSFINSIVANGNKVMPVGTSFRNYDGNTVNDEALGSLPFDDAIVKPTLSLIPDDMSDGKGEEYFSLYNFVRNNAELIQKSPTDPVHLNEMGNQLHRHLFVDSISARLLGSAPITIPRIENPTGLVAIPREDMTHFNPASSGNRGSSLVFGANEIGTGCVDFFLAPLTGYLPSSVTLTQPVDSEGNNGNAFDTGDASQSLTNDGVKNAYIYDAATTWVVLQTRKGYNAGQTVMLEVVSYKASGGAKNSDFSVDGGSTFATIDASTLSPSHSHTFTAIADVNGEVTLMGRASAGDSFVYLSGTRATPV